jgi:hypothetical protein
MKQEENHFIFFLLFFLDEKRPKVLRFRLFCLFLQHDCQKVQSGLSFSTMTLTTEERKIKVEKKYNYEYVGQRTGAVCGPL